MNADVIGIELNDDGTRTESIWRGVTLDSAMEWLQRIALECHVVRGPVRLGSRGAELTIQTADGIYTWVANAVSPVGTSEPAQAVQPPAAARTIPRQPRRSQ